MCVFSLKWFCFCCCVKVLTLVSRTEQLRDGESVPAAIQRTIVIWSSGISKLHHCRRDEIVNAASRYHGHSSQQQKEKGPSTCRMFFTRDVADFCFHVCYGASTAYWNPGFTKTGRPLELFSVSAEAFG